MAAQSDAEKRTYRYLRLAMVAVLVMLGVAVLREHAKTFEKLAHGCWQGSVSAYYYTPAHAVFVGALVAVGVCMIVLKGEPRLEDVLLNVCGMLAPVVAFVPTPNPGDCSSAPAVSRDTSADIGNNMFAYFGAGILGLVISIGLWWSLRGTKKRWTRTQIGGLVVSILLLITAMTWLGADPDSVREYAHYAAAIPLFILFTIIVVQNARAQSKKSDQKYRTLYTRLYQAIAGMMSLSLVVGFFGWLVTRELFVTEAVVLALFVFFWLVQTVELWDEGVRPEPEASKVQEAV